MERLARALNMDEISHDIGVDLHTESLLLRAEQLARLESDKLVDKVSVRKSATEIEKVGTLNDVLYEDASSLTKKWLR